MRPDKQNIPANEAPAIFELASQYVSANLERYSLAELEAAAEEAGISAKYIPQAIEEIQAKNTKKEEKRQYIR